MTSNVPLNSDTPAWRFQTWAAFVLALASTSIGIWWLPVGPWEKAFLAIGVWFTVSSSFALAKSERDRHESQKLSSKVAEVQTERFLRELGKDAA